MPGIRQNWQNRNPGHRENRYRRQDGTHSVTIKRIIANLHPPFRDEEISEPVSLRAESNGQRAESLKNIHAEDRLVMTIPPYQPALTQMPCVSSEVKSRVEADYERFAQQGLPGELENYLLAEHGVDVSTTYAGFPIKNPWGKASGQLSMTAHQVADDVAAGLGFVVLKTVIAQDETGEQTMRAWAIPEARMVVEPITGLSGETGWTVSWKGRGWWLTFEEYLKLIEDSQSLAQGTGTLIVPSCKFHLPTAKEPAWKTAEYDFTVPKLLAAWGQADPGGPRMPLEKDFSPTLAGSDRASEQAQILSWLRTVPRLIRSAGPALVGLKLFNALFEDEFQLEMLRAIHQPGPDRPEFFIYGNRLFDPERVFEGHKGIAYGGPDLSDRNLRVMSAFQRETGSQSNITPLEWSATGNITTGRMALEYALLGASSFQLHTYFQLPNDQYRMKQGSRTARAIHELYFHPERGLIVGMHEIARRLGHANGPIRLRDIVGRRLELGD